VVCGCCRYDQVISVLAKLISQVFLPAGRPYQPLTTSVSLLLFSRQPPRSTILRHPLLLAFELLTSYIIQRPGLAKGAIEYIGFFSTMKYSVLVGSLLFLVSATAQNVSNDGTCGSNGGLTCQGSGSGDCCSQ
jgi:hypothetical protein